MQPQATLGSDHRQALDAEIIVANLVALARIGLPVALTEQDGRVQVGILNLVDLTADDYFVAPIPIDDLTIAEEGGRG